MFPKEAKMIGPVIDWMQSLRLIVKSEFVSPWGHCDLVGLSFTKRKIANRLKLRQLRPIGSVSRAALLFHIPDITTRDSITVRQLARELSPSISYEVINIETERLIADNFVIRSSRSALQRLDGWMPMHKRLIAVELKLNRIEEAMSQARNNLSFADQSYIALPEELAVRVSERPERWATSLRSGIGVLAVTPQTCRVLIGARRSSVVDPILQFYCTEKFWRTHPKGS